MYSTGMVAEAAAFGVEHESLGQIIVATVSPRDGVSPNAESLIAACRERLPAFMVPARIEWKAGPLPRNPNGKIDRKALSAEFTGLAASPI